MQNNSITEVLSILKQLVTVLEEAKNIKSAQLMELSTGLKLCVRLSQMSRSDDNRIMTVEYQLGRADVTEFSYEFPIGDMKFRDEWQKELAGMWAELGKHLARKFEDALTGDKKFAEALMDMFKGR